MSVNVKFHICMLTQFAISGSKQYTMAASMQICVISSSISEQHRLNLYVTWTLVIPN